jgi:hypothetical protein
MAETPWLELPYRSLSKENVRAEAARRGLTFRKLMALYYQHDRERAVHLSLHWCVDRDHPKKLFGKARVGQFVEDLKEFLEEARVKLMVAGDLDPHGLDKLRALKEERRAGDLQQQRPQQGPGPSNPRKRKRGGNRKAKDARRRPRQQRTTPAAALPLPVPSICYVDRDGNEFWFTAAGVELVCAAKPPAKRSGKRARRSPSTSSSSSSASSSSSSSSSSSASSSSSSSGSYNSFCDWLFAPSSASSDSSSSSEDDHPPRAEPSAPTTGGGAVPAAEAASPPPEVESHLLQAARAGGRRPLDEGLPPRPAG